MKKTLLLAIAMLASPWSHAGEQIGTILYVRVRASDGLIYFALNGTKTGASPSCATNSYWIIRDENSNAGKQQYGMLLAAQLAGRSVAVSGLNSCARWIDGEDAAEMRIAD
jgi:hypothetical protein